ncbi:CP family cyanate transporter-like MFS transporter [Pseudonocardia sediminis]|uniref:CP family cyanate transporter-like MFS transporter n=1 Tax=Pseudonocardia sediminis TaxID=1397368 RepID=A0A4Q7URY5_PSEST|nr:MFS transporter [Pseudonocardia sediminis]RZT83481.1 CP family cyanate transporter-like MFS transporter [Pseudonocardia sediminis]
MSIQHAEDQAEETVVTRAAESVDHRRHAALVGTPLLVVGVALAASNLRPAVTSMASVLGEVRDDLGASSVWASVLTSAPTICFGLAAVAAPLLGRRFGMARAVGISLAVLTLGLLMRVIDGPWVVLGGTFVAAAGIAIGNVLIPVVVKESFPNAVGRVTGVYTAALAAGGGIGAAFTPPMEALFGGWRASVGAWAALSLAALLVWGIGARHGTTGGVARAGGDGAVPERRSLLRSPLAWAVTAFFGLQALVAYTAMGWLAELFVSVGIPRTDAGYMLALVNMIGIPLSFIVPPLALNRRSQSGWIVGMASVGLASVIGMAIAPAAAPWLWTVMLGVGMGVFPLGLGVIAVRTRNSVDTTSLSAMAQGFGYLFGASGPFLFGLLHGISGGWTLSLSLLAVVIVAEMVLGWIVGRPRYV